MGATILDMTTDAVQAKVAKSIRACRFCHIMYIYEFVCLCFLRFLNLGYIFLYLHIHELRGSWISKTTC